MKIAIIGAKGMLGTDLQHVLGKEHEILAWDIEEVDITDRARTIDALRTEAPDLILNSAALVNVETCESNPDLAWQINVVGAQNLALAAQAANSALLYICTDYIFDGQNETDYDEVAQPNPLNQYGRTKLAGERLSIQNCPRTYSIRTAWLFGHKTGNYVDRVLTAATNEGVVRMPVDQIESPTYSYHLAEMLNHLIATGAYGIYNVTSLGACTRAGFAQYVLQQAGRSERVEIVEASEIKRTTRRPTYAALDCRLVQLVTQQTLPNWQTGIDAYLAAEGLLIS